MDNNENDYKVYKQWYFWVIVLLIALGFILINSFKSNQTSKKSNTSINNTNISTNTTKSTDIPKVSIIDFSQMSKEEIQDWCTKHNVKCHFTEYYSDTIEKGKFVSQSAEPNKSIYEGKTITITYSLGKEPTNEEKNALKKALSYSQTMHMSKKGIYKQLISEYGEGFTVDAAQYAIDHLEVDWKANALAKAQTYQSSMSMSKSAIYKQLISDK